ncbi:MAG TPA: FtsX-like permease family protein, partial [Puia sp.]|nr:FtsX-like permease family protein [Puia sp.]
MLKNYFIAAIRNFRRNKLFSLINVLGLSIGISASLIIYLVVHYDFSFDRFEKNGDRIYRVVSEFAFDGNPGHNRGVPAPLGDAIQKEVPGLEEVSMFRWFNVDKLAVRGPDPSKPKVFRNQDGIIFADRHYFSLLPYRWLAGSPATALQEPGKVILAETAAKLFFPSLSYTDMIGQRIVYADSISTVVSGIVRDLDASGHTDFIFQEFISLGTVLDNPGLRKNFYWDEWGSTTSDQQLYIRLSPRTTRASAEAGLKALFNKHQGEDAKKGHYTWTYRLQPLDDIHFNSFYGTFSQHLANKPTLYGLLLVAGFLLLLGCINFINLNTAQASQRAREIGIRKTLGSSRQQLILQFLYETFLITIGATLLSLLLTPPLLNVFAGFVPKDLHFSLDSLIHQPHLLFFILFLIVGVSLLAGFYPALFLSSWQPINVLKSNVQDGSGKTQKVWVRQILTVSQFVIAQVFVMGTLLVSKQIHFLLDKDLGFKKDAILSFNTPNTDTSYSKRLVLLQELRQIPGIALTSLGSDVPASGGTWTTIMKYQNGKKEIQRDVELKFGDTNYLRLFHIPLLAGRNILASDTVREILINESYLHSLGFQHPEDALGKSISWDKTTPIVGVIKDFHAHPLNMDIKPMAYSFSGKDCKTLIIALKPRTGEGEQWKAAIAGMERAYKKLYPEEDFNYAFLDESIAGFYENEQKISDLLRWATGLTILISCLGLLGLVIYTTNRRVKEIGVRKVLGASVSQIVSVLSKDFLKLVCLAFVIATPMAWWAIHEWMQSFTYRTSISWWVFLVSG